MTLSVRHERDTGLSIARCALSERITDFDDELFSDFEIQTLYDKDKPIGTLFLRGPEIHVAILREHRRRWISRALIKNVLSPLIMKYGCAVTSVMLDNEVGKDFVTRLGFIPVSVCNGAVNYVRSRPT